MDYKRLQTLLKKVTTSVVSLLMMYVVLDCIVLRFMLHLVPLPFWGYLPEKILPLAQYSKNETIPKSYILIVGDSYAVGLGDWYDSVKQNGRPFFSSAHIIHIKTGKNIVSLGQSGFGSLHAIVMQPILAYENLQSTLFFKLPAPKMILVYFFEGNDLNNNLQHIRTEFDPNYDRRHIYDPNIFKSFIENRVVIHPQHHSFGENLFTYQIVRNIYRNRKETVPEKRHPRASGTFNKVLIKGQSTAIPDSLQSPALELTNEEIDLGVYVLEQSLHYLSSYFQNSRIGIVYIPSPLSSYNLTSSEISIQTYEGRKAIYPKGLVTKQSDLICRKIQEIALKNNYLFIDTRSIIRADSKNHLLHGPNDWKHFNQFGYNALAEAVVMGLNDSKSEDALK